jgi:hypothetical protein
MKHIKQFRYFGPSNPNNSPISVEEKISTNVLTGTQYFSQFMPITKIGIQTLPGTKFYLNDLSG